ncbi:MAG: NAD(P)H-binding protein, partial [Hyphomonadaceae bacterium]
MKMTIDVDMDVYKALGAMGASDADSYNRVLRNLLKLQGSGPTAEFAVQRGDAKSAAAAAARAGETARSRQAPKENRKLKLAILGAAGSIGGKTVDEALSRGLDVIAVARDPAKLAAKPGAEARIADANDAAAVAKALSGADAAIVAVKWAGVDVQNVLEGVRASGVKRAIFILGCGTLFRDDGRRHFIHVAEGNKVPVPATVPAMRVLEALKADA